MAFQISIRGISEEVRDELAARAAMQRQSMQEFLRGELERIAWRPSVDTWLENVRRRKRRFKSSIGSEEILNARDADRE
ncbi:MAG: hypothetical protein OXF31_04845 [Gammaproteobacteria bacterium]|nr:hypothetical protein [Gammaproteobacteria bacterium]